MVGIQTRSEFRPVLSVNTIITLSLGTVEIIIIKIIRVPKFRDEHILFLKVSIHIATLKKTNPKSVQNT